VARAFPDAKLLVVGDGRERGKLEAIARAHLPPGFCVFAGSVAHSKVAEYYALADVSLNFLEDKEANRYRASIKTREALCAGVPVVASCTPDSERFAEWVRLAPGASAEEFVEALLLELASPARERAAAGATWLAEHGTHDACVRELAELWEREVP
jgi:glycosyltransferase involved in cell wall biosynthesis